MKTKSPSVPVAAVRRLIKKLMALRDGYQKCGNFECACGFFTSAQELRALLPSAKRNK